MNTSGIIIMVISVTSVLTLCGYCYYKILTEKKPHHPAPLDIDTGDLDED